MRVDVQSGYRLSKPLAIRTKEGAKKQAPLWIWILLTLPGWLVASFSEQTLMLDFAAVLSTILMLRWFWEIIGNSFEMLRLLQVATAALCALQNISWLVASLLHRFSLNIPIEKSIAGLMPWPSGLRISSYSLAIFYVSCFAMITAFLGSRVEIIRLEQYLHKVLINAKKIPIYQLTRILFILSCLELVMVAAGYIGQRSLIVEGLNEGERPTWIVFYETLLPAQIILNALLCVQMLKPAAKRQKKQVPRIILFFSLAMLLFLYFNRGRSGLVFSILALGYWIILFLDKKPKFFKVFLIAAIVYPVITQMLLFNNFIRSSNAGIKEWKGSAIEVLPQAWERFQSSSSMIKEEEHRTTENLSTRPLVAAPLAMSMQLPVIKKSFTLGEILYNSAVWAIPGPIFPNKKDYPVQEALLYDHFPIGEADMAESVYLSSYNDFGWLGLLIYPVLLFGLWAMILFIIKKQRTSPQIVIVIVSIFFQLFVLGIGESSIVEWFVTIRSFLAWIAINHIWYSIVNKKKRINMATVSNR